MNFKKLLLAFLAITSLGLASGGALAYGHIGVYIGGPVIWPGYYGPYYAPYYYPPTPVVIPTAPTTYIEQGPPATAASAPAADSSWYYCADSKTYYPYVKQCASGWQRVAPQPQQ